MSEIILAGYICIGFSIFGVFVFWFFFGDSASDAVLILLSLCCFFALLGQLFCGVGFVSSLTHILTK